MSSAEDIRRMYDAMLDRLGPSHWWPADTPFEVAVGAVLTQNTNWKNVEKAIENLKVADCLNPVKMHTLSTSELAELIRPAGYYNVKATRLGHFLTFLRDEAEYKIENLAERSLEKLRPRFLSVKGIGPETADSILLYALNKPTFVIDAYTFRLMQRHGHVYEGMNYHELQSLFESALEPDTAIYGEYHALIVRMGKKWCKKQTGLCDECPLKTFLPC